MQIAWQHLVCARNRAHFEPVRGGAQRPTQGIQTRRNRRRFARDSQKPPAEPAAVRRSRKLTAHHSTGSPRVALPRIVGAQVR
jgi:hypothetical protein